MAYHPTQLSMLTNNCPAALDFRDKGTPYDRTLFAAGITAHAILEHAGNKVREVRRQLSPDEIDSISEGVVMKLIGEGRSYDGTPEPPLNPERVFEGRDIASAYLRNHSLSESAKCEIGLAFDKDWAPATRHRGRPTSGNSIPCNAGLRLSPHGSHRSARMWMASAFEWSTSAPGQSTPATYG